MCAERKVEEQVRRVRGRRMLKQQKKNLIPTGAVMKIHTEATCPSSSKFSDSLQEFVQVSRWASGED